MSEVKTDKLTGTTSAGSIVVTGEGGSTTTNMQQGLAKAWSQVKQTDTWAMNDSFNISSGVDSGTGLAGMTLTSNFNNVYYSAHCTNDSGGWGHTGTIDNVTTSFYSMIQMQTDTTGAADSIRTQSTAHGDLA
jgi:hypothetical protein